MAKREIVVTTKRTFCDHCHEPMAIRGRRAGEVRSVVASIAGETFELDFCTDACRVDWKGEHLVSAKELLGDLTVREQENYQEALRGVGVGEGSY